MKAPATIDHEKASAQEKAGPRTWDPERQWRPAHTRYEQLVQLCRITQVMHAGVRVRNPYLRLIAQVPMPRVLCASSRPRYEALFIALVEASVRINHVHRLEVRKGTYQATREDITNVLALLREDVYPHTLLTGKHRQFHDQLRDFFGEEAFTTRTVFLATRMSERNITRYLGRLHKAQLIERIGGQKHNPGWIYKLVPLDR